MPTPALHQEVVAWLDAHTDVLPAEQINAADSAGRVLASSVVAERDHPSTTVAAVDGFALHADASVGASEYNPLAFHIVESGARSVSSDQAAPVVSGETLPQGADTVIHLLETDLRGQVLDVYAPIAAGENVIPAGREARGGEQVLDAGRILRPADAAMLVELDAATVPVVRRPRVDIVTARGQGDGATGIMIRALVTRDGGCFVEPARSDEPLADKLAARDGELLLVIGGSGFGPNDPCAAALGQAGELVSRGVAINPGETTTIGLVNGTPVVVVPGPPLPALFAYDAVAGRAVRRLGGRGSGWPYGSRRARLGRKIASGLGLLECCRVRVSGDSAEPIAVSDNRTLSTVLHADGFVLVPEHSEGFAEDTEVTVYLYDQRF